jgi:hypothetical protein
MITLDEIDRLVGGRIGEFDTTCPRCSALRSSPARRRLKVLKIWRNQPDFASFNCVHCGASGYARDDACGPPDRSKIAKVRAEAAEQHRLHKAKRLRKAKWLWSIREPIVGSIAETYLRGGRGYRGPIPPTLALLPAKDEHPPAMIAAFGIATEVTETGPCVSAIDDDAVVGVHLTRLLPDGSDRERGDQAKIRIGIDVTAPIVLAPPNDLLALCIAEGIEDALTAHQAMGFGGWVSGGSTFLPELADHVPSYIECVTIIVDDNDAGRRGSAGLAERLDVRGIEVMIDGWLP